MFNSYTNKVKLRQSENKALIWATDFLFPLYEIKSTFLEYKNYRIDYLLDNLNVNREFFIKRLKFLSKYNPFIDIDEKTILNLCSLLT